MTSMLTETRGNTIPSDVELNEISGKLSEATEPAECLAASLGALADYKSDSELVRLTPEQAWHLHFYSADYRMEGERLLRFAKEIEEHSMQIYLNQLGPRYSERS